MNIQDGNLSTDDDKPNSIRKRRIEVTEFLSGLTYWIFSGNLKMAWVYTQLKWTNHPEIFGEMLMWILVFVCFVYVLKMFAMRLK